MARTPRRRAWPHGECNRLDVFAQAAGQTMLHQTYDGKYWYPADDLGPAIVGSPGAVAWGPDRLDIFVRGTDNQLWQMAYAGGSWVGYFPLGGFLTSSPAVSSWGENRLDVFIRGSDNALYHMWWNGYWLEPVRAARWQPRGCPGSHFARPEPDRRLLPRARQPPLSEVVRRLDLAATPRPRPWATLRRRRVLVGDCGGSISSARVTTTRCSTDRGTAEVGPAGRRSAPDIDDTPSAVSWDENRIDVVALGSNGHLMHKHLSSE